MSDTNIDVFAYGDRDKAYITVCTIEEPYGEGTQPVVSIGCTLKGDVNNPSWKVHIPADLLEDVALALYKRSPKSLARIHLEDSDKRSQKKSLRNRLDGELRAIQNMIDRRDSVDGRDMTE